MNGRPDFLEMSENERIGLGLCRACRAISQYEEKCKIDPATVARDPINRVKSNFKNGLKVTERFSLLLSSTVNIKLAP